MFGSSIESQTSDEKAQSEELLNLNGYSRVLTSPSQNLGGSRFGGAAVKTSGRVFPARPPQASPDPTPRSTAAA